MTTVFSRAVPSIGAERFEMNSEQLYQRRDAVGGTIIQLRRREGFEHYVIVYGGPQGQQTGSGGGDSYDQALERALDNHDRTMVAGAATATRWANDPDEVDITERRKP